MSWKMRHLWILFMQVSLCWWMCADWWGEHWCGDQVRWQFQREINVHGQSRSVSLWHCWVFLLLQRWLRWLLYNYNFRTYIAFTLGVAGGFFGYISPNLKGFGWNLEYKCETTVCTHIKFLGEINQGLPSNGAKTCFFLLPIQCGLLDTYSAPVFDRVWKKQAWIGVSECMPQEVFEFLHRGFASSKNCPRKQYLGGLLQHLSPDYQTAQFQATGIILETSWHTKNVPFAHGFWWGMYCLGAMSRLK